MMKDKICWFFGIGWDMVEDGVYDCGSSWCMWEEIWVNRKTGERIQVVSQLAP